MRFFMRSVYSMMLMFVQVYFPDTCVSPRQRKTSVTCTPLGEEASDGGFPEEGRPRLDGWLRRVHRNSGGGSGRGGGAAVEDGG